MNHSDWSKKDLEYIWHPCSQMKDYETLPPIVIDHGKGVSLYDVDGKRYLDVVSSGGATCWATPTPKSTAPSRNSLIPWSMSSSPTSRTGRLSPCVKN